MVILALVSLFIFVRAKAGVCALWHTCGDQKTALSTPLPLCRSWKSYLCYQTHVQATLPDEPSCQPMFKSLITVTLFPWWWGHFNFPIGVWGFQFAHILTNMILLGGKPTRDHHMATLRAEEQVFIAGQRLHRELVRIMHPKPHSPLSLMHKNDILVGKLHLARSRTAEAKEQG